MSSFVGPILMGPGYFALEAATAGGNSPCPVSIEPDMTTRKLSAGSFIDHLLPEGSIDQPAPMNWPPGAGVKKHVFSSGKPVLHKWKAIALSGHDLGPQLPHLPLGPGILTNLITLPGSSRKVLFTASTVKMCGNATGAVSCRHYLPMFNCAEITGLADNVSNDAHSVFVGLTALDRLLGAMEAIVTIAYDTVAFVLSMESLGKDGLQSLAPDPEGVAKKSLRDSLIAVTKSVLISEESGWKTPIVVPFEFGGNDKSVFHKSTFNPTTKQWTVEEGVTVRGRTAKFSLGSDQKPSATADDDFVDTAAKPGSWGLPL